MTLKIQYFNDISKYDIKYNLKCNISITFKIQYFNDIRKAKFQFH